MKNKVYNYEVFTGIRNTLTVLMWIGCLILTAYNSMWGIFAGLLALGGFMINDLRNEWIDMSIKKASQK